MLGPALPPGFRRQADDDEEDDDDDDDGVSGPALPPGYTASQSSSDEGEEEEDVIGPMPARGAVQDSVALDFERRAQKMKDKLTKGDVSDVTYSTRLSLRCTSFRSMVTAEVLHPARLRGGGQSVSGSKVRVCCCVLTGGPGGAGQGGVDDGASSRAAAHRSGRSHLQEEVWACQQGPLSLDRDPC